jgi:hypothetical protein
MPVYKIQVSETFNRVYLVNADNEEDATDHYWEGDMDDEEFVDHEIIDVELYNKPSVKLKVKEPSNPIDFIY